MHQNQKSTLFTRKKTLLQEIKRDPLAADLIFTLFASAVGTDFFDPNTPTPKEKTLEEIVKTMPPMQQLASYSNESELIDAIGSEAFDVLRCAILDCPSAYALLNDSLEIPELKEQNLMIKNVINSQLLNHQQKKRNFSNYAKKK